MSVLRKNEREGIQPSGQIRRVMEQGVTFKRQISIGCTALKKITISNNQLKTLVLRECKQLMEADIDTPNEFKGEKLIPFMSRLEEAELCFESSWQVEPRFNNEDDHSPCFASLQTFMEFDYSRGLKLVVRYNKLLENLLDDILQTSHPAKLSSFSTRGMMLLEAKGLQLMRKKLMAREKDPDCCTYNACRQGRTAYQNLTIINIFFNHKLKLKLLKHHDHKNQNQTESRILLALNLPMWDIWVTYLSKFVKRYGKSKLERARELFEHAVETTPSDTVKPLYLQYAKLEEDFGLAKRAMKVEVGKEIDAEEVERIFGFAELDVVEEVLGAGRVVVGDDGRGDDGELLAEIAEAEVEFITELNGIEEDEQRVRAWGFRRR
ncbi:hypothetical protein F3Y22_tig00000143pilonHSYRG00001 [Hibiscus syriacus]|uniref:Pre-mRNA-splicing factor Syf1/CRNKL1-like C-terminal HAT-repeats domain-containing protein n=1 Tax=Hibiscus syriacus TaxID=106335 RepID=A0A6A3D2Z1_HIBSY|nr:hypothetical protein F3Y22_tig00000143pilonHSYRG00001 [Hibiscus syriacus]